MYFLTGHGEDRIDDFDRRTGTSSIARLLRQANIEVHSLNLEKSPKIPDNCDTLVISGPQSTISINETHLINDYLNRGGRAFVLLDANIETGLDKMLYDWGIVLGTETVFLGNQRSYDLPVTKYGDHPITKGLGSFTTVFNMPRLVEPLLETHSTLEDVADRPSVTVLAAGEWAKNTADRVLPVFDSKTDRHGSIPIAVAMEKGKGSGTELQVRTPRMVVVGDSSFISNAALNAKHNVSFFRNALRWLISNPVPLVITAQPEDRIPVHLSSEKKQPVFWTLIAGIPALVVFSGLLVWGRRRK